MNEDCGQPILGTYKHLIAKPRDTNAQKSNN